MARRTSGSVAGPPDSRSQRPSSVAMNGGGHAAGDLAGVVAAHAVGQHGQGAALVDDDGVFVVAARAAGIDGR